MLAINPSCEIRHDFRCQGINHGKGTSSIQRCFSQRTKPPFVGDFRWPGLIPGGNCYKLLIFPCILSDFRVRLVTTWGQVHPCLEATLTRSPGAFEAQTSGLRAMGQSALQWNVKTCGKHVKKRMLSPKNHHLMAVWPQKVWSIAAVNAEVQKIPKFPALRWPKRNARQFFCCHFQVWSSSGCFGNDDDVDDDDVVDDDDDGDGCCFLRGQGWIYLSLCFLLHYFWLFLTILSAWKNVLWHLELSESGSLRLGWMSTLVDWAGGQPFVISDLIMFWVGIPD